jgi:CBS domain-containing protein
MPVSQILKDKGASVYTCSPLETVAAAAAVLHARRVGALVVMDEDDHVVGILSERDVVRVIAQQGFMGLKGPVSSCMTRGVIYADPAQDVAALMTLMTDRRIRHLPVCLDGRLVGIVSIGDLVKCKIAQSEAEAEALKAYIAQV